MEAETMPEGLRNANFLAEEGESALSRQKVGVGVIALVSLLAVTVAGAWYTAKRHRQPADPEIAVLVSRSNTTTWPRFVQSFTAAAKRHGCTIAEVPDAQADRLRIIFPAGDSVVFKLYKELGHAGLRERVLSLCESPNAPIAVLSGSNSGSARVVAEALRDREASGRPAPVYLLTSGTVDDLTTIHPKKTFRFGHNNSKQAAAVVRDVLERMRERGTSASQIQLAVFEIKDNPFACEFSGLVKKEVEAAFKSRTIAFKELILPTAVAPADSPTEKERENAVWLARKMSDDPWQQWLVVLPANAEANRRMWQCHYEALQELGANNMALHLDNVMFIAGDSLDFVDFTGALKPHDLHSRAVFYAQYDPRLDAKGVPDPVLVREALYHEIAETVMGTLQDPSARKSVGGLRQALADYRRSPGDALFFDGPERRSGGGPVMVRSTISEAKFEFDFSNFAKQ
jgi:hypothetical protein